MQCYRKDSSGQGKDYKKWERAWFVPHICPSPSFLGYKMSDDFDPAEVLFLVEQNQLATYYIASTAAFLIYDIGELRPIIVICSNLTSCQQYALIKRFVGWLGVVLHLLMIVSQMKYFWVRIFILHIYTVFWKNFGQQSKPQRPISWLYYIIRIFAILELLPGLVGKLSLFLKLLHDRAKLFALKHLLAAWILRGMQNQTLWWTQADKSYMACPFSSCEHSQPFPRYRNLSCSCRYKIHHLEWSAQ